MNSPLSRDDYFREMGLGPIWHLRSNDAAAEPSEEAADPAWSADDGASAAPQTDAAAALATPAPTASPLAAASAATPPANEREAAIARMDWDELEASIAACRACVLCQKRQKVVPGVGDRHPDWLFVGEGPGAEEDMRGEPFVGQAGKLLDNMLAAIDLKRGDKVYIANAVKCRPPGNRTPQADEIAACWPYLKRQIELAQPKLMVLMGRPAVAAVLGGDKSIASLRGQRHRYGEQLPTVVTYHPAYLLRNLPDKAKAWEDLCFARQLLTAAK